jgi:hypothetical protein
MMKRIAVAVGLVLVASGLGQADTAATPGIQWEQHVFTGFQKALKEKKLMVVYFRQDFCEQCKGPCKHCAKIDAIMRGEQIAAMADRAIWVWQTHGNDDAQKNVEKLRKELGIDRFPTVVVLEVSTVELKEINRVVGVFPEEEFLRLFLPLLQGPGVN